MAGYSGTPLIRKLGIKAGMKVMYIDEPDHYSILLGELPQPTHIIGLEEAEMADFIHLFCQDKEALYTRFPRAKSKLQKDGILWVSWTKKSSKKYVYTLSDMDVRRLGLKLGLVDIKVCAVDEDWSALKFMYRKRDR